MFVSTNTKNKINETIFCWKLKAEIITRLINKSIKRKLMVNYLDKILF